MFPWIDPPLHMRQGTEEGDWSVAISHENDNGDIKSHITRRKELSAAQTYLTNCIKNGCQGRVYDKDGALV